MTPTKSFLRVLVVVVVAAALGLLIVEQLAAEETDDSVAAVAIEGAGTPQAVADATDAVATRPANGDAEADEPASDGTVTPDVPEETPTNEPEDPATGDGQPIPSHPTEAAPTGQPNENEAPATPASDDQTAGEVEGESDTEGAAALVDAVEFSDVPGGATVTIRKVDQFGAPVPGLCYGVFTNAGDGAPGEQVAGNCDSADAEGEDGTTTIDGLPPGDYVLNEERVPEGLVATQRPFTIAADDETVELVVQGTVQPARVQVIACFFATDGAPRTEFDVLVQEPAVVSAAGTAKGCVLGEGVRVAFVNTTNRVVTLLTTDTNGRDEAELPPAIYLVVEIPSGVGGVAPLQPGGRYIFFVQKFVAPEDLPDNPGSDSGDPDESGMGELEILVFECAEGGTATQLLVAPPAVAAAAGDEAQESGVSALSHTCQSGTVRVRLGSSAPQEISAGIVARVPAGTYTLSELCSRQKVEVDVFAGLTTKVLILDYGAPCATDGLEPAHVTVVKCFFPTEGTPRTEFDVRVRVTAEMAAADVDEGCVLGAGVEVSFEETFSGDVTTLTTDVNGRAEASLVPGDYRVTEVSTGAAVNGSIEPGGDYTFFVQNFVAADDLPENPGSDPGDPDEPGVGELHIVVFDCAEGGTTTQLIAVPPVDLASALVNTTAMSDEGIIAGLSNTCEAGTARIRIGNSTARTIETGAHIEMAAGSYRLAELCSRQTVEVEVFADRTTKLVILDYGAPCATDGLEPARITVVKCFFATDGSPRTQIDLRGRVPTAASSAGTAEGCVLGAGIEVAFEETFSGDVTVLTTDANGRAGADLVPGDYIVVEVATRVGGPATFQPGADYTFFVQNFVAPEDLPENPGSDPGDPGDGEGGLHILVFDCAEGGTTTQLIAVPPAVPAEQQVNTAGAGDEGDEIPDTCQPGNVRIRVDGFAALEIETGLHANLAAGTYRVTELCSRQAVEFDVFDDQITKLLILDYGAPCATDGLDPAHVTVVKCFFATDGPPRTEFDLLVGESLAVAAAGTNEGCTLGAGVEVSFVEAFSGDVTVLTTDPNGRAETSLVPSHYRVTEVATGAAVDVPLEPGLDYTFFVQNFVAEEDLPENPGSDPGEPGNDGNGELHILVFKCAEGGTATQLLVAPPEVVADERVGAAALDEDSAIEAFGLNGTCEAGSARVRVAGFAPFTVDLGFSFKIGAGVHQLVELCSRQTVEVDVFAGLSTQLLILDYGAPCATDGLDPAHVTIVKCFFATDGPPRTEFDVRRQLLAAAEAGAADEGCVLGAGVEVAFEEAFSGDVTVLTTDANGRAEADLVPSDYEVTEVATGFGGGLTLEPGVHYIFYIQNFVAAEDLPENPGSDPGDPDESGDGELHILVFDCAEGGTTTQLVAIPPVGLANDLPSTTAMAVSAGDAELQEAFDTCKTGTALVQIHGFTPFSVSTGVVAELSAGTYRLTELCSGQTAEIDVFAGRTTELLIFDYGAPCVPDTGDADEVETLPVTGTGSPNSDALGLSPNLVLGALGLFLLAGVAVAMRSTLRAHQSHRHRP